VNPISHEIVVVNHAKFDFFLNAKGIEQAEAGTCRGDPDADWQGGPGEAREAAQSQKHPRGRKLLFQA